MFFKSWRIVSIQFFLGLGLGLLYRTYIFFSTGGCNYCQYWLCLHWDWWLGSWFALGVCVLDMATSLHKNGHAFWCELLCNAVLNQSVSHHLWKVIIISDVSCSCYCFDVDVICSVWFVMFSKRSNFITRLAADKKQSLIMRLLHLAEVLNIDVFNSTTTCDFWISNWSHIAVHLVILVGGGLLFKKASFNTLMLLVGSFDL